MIANIIFLCAFLFQINYAMANADSKSGYNEFCHKDIFCYWSQDMGDSIVFSVMNMHFADITITIKAELINLDSKGSLPFTIALSGGDSTKMFSLYKINNNQAYEYKTSQNVKWGNNSTRHNDSYIYSLPYISGERFTVSQGYGGTFSHFDDTKYAIDWLMPIGTPFYAAREGTVIKVEEKFRIGLPLKLYKDSCNFILIQHEDGTLGEYIHLMMDGANVKSGDYVKKGALLGRSGNTGYSSGPHLHFCVCQPIDGELKKTIPIKFDTKEGKGIELEEGKSYTSE